MKADKMKINNYAYMKIELSVHDQYQHNLRKLPISSNHNVN